MNIISITKDNIDIEHICCAIGKDKKNKACALTKKDWMKRGFSDGLVFKRLNQRGKVFVEYMPIEKVWKPVVGRNFMFINCLWVSGKFKGQGWSTKLLDECIKDSKKLNMDGIAVVTSSKVKPFLTDKKFFIKHGFEVVDQAEPYFEMLTLKFDARGENPRFKETVRNSNVETSSEICFVYSNQCPYMEEYVGLYSNMLEERGITYEVVKLSSYKEAQSKGSPFGTFAMYHRGKFLSHELMSEKKFEKFLNDLKLND